MSCQAWSVSGRTLADDGVYLTPRTASQCFGGFDATAPIPPVRIWHRSNNMSMPAIAQRRRENNWATTLPLRRLPR
eukprot:652845-Rhodomonas_salina.10